MLAATLLAYLLSGGLVATEPERPLSGEPNLRARVDHAAGSRSRDGSGVWVIDGDTLTIDGERIRLLAIDACETHAPQRLPGCTREKGEQATQALQTLIAHKPLRIERYGSDRYGRTLAIVYAGQVNINCRMMAGGWAVYVRRYDDGLRVAKLCEAAR